MMIKKKRIIFIRSLVILFIVIAAVATYYFTAIFKQVKDFQKTGEASPFHRVDSTQLQDVQPPDWEGSEPVNILLMGVDSRGFKKGEVPRSDTMMVASLDPVGHRVHLFSIMRDTYVEIYGHGSERINTAILHGPNTAMKTVSTLLGIPIQYYVYTDFQGFIALVNSIGGVDYTVEKDMHYTSAADNHEFDIDLKKGFQHLDGISALQYVRFRHDALSDYARTDRQRNLLKAVMSKMKSSTTLIRLPSILENINPYIDTNLTISDMWKLARVGYDSQMASSEQIPPMKLLVEKKVHGASVLGVKNSKQLKLFVQDIIHKEDRATSDQINKPKSVNPSL